jgi:hypothetical protein
MDRVLEFSFPPELGPEWAARIDEVLAGESLLQTILHAHLLLERGIGDKVQSRLMRPDIMEGRWSFDQKLSLYIGLFDPPEPQVSMLKGFNILRNKIAHNFVDIDAAVEHCLPWASIMPDWAIRGHTSDSRSRVRTIAMTLLFDLQMVTGVRRTDF